METRRQQIAEYLRGDAMTPSDLAAAVDTSPTAVLKDIQHVAESLAGTEEQLMAAPPRCMDCEFDGFDDLVNLPSRCPECHSERIAEPTFTVRPVDPST